MSDQPRSETDATLVSQPSASQPPVPQPPWNRWIQRINWSTDWPYLIGATIVALAMQLSFGYGLPGTMAQGFTDNFTYMNRLLESDWWTSRGWFEQYNAPDGMLLHWTYPFSVLLTLLALPFRLFMEWPTAIVFVGTISAFLCALVVATLTYYLARTINSRGWSFIAAVLVLTSNPIMSYGTFGRPDHHMMALALVAGFWLCLVKIEQYRSLYTATDQASTSQANTDGANTAQAATDPIPDATPDSYGRYLAYHILAGLLAGLALWTAPETQAGLVIGLAVQCWHRILIAQNSADSPGRDHDAADDDAPGDSEGGTPFTKPRVFLAELAFALSWTVLLVAAVWVDPPYEGLWAEAHDRISIVHILFAACTGLLIIGRMPVLWGLARLGHQRLVPQMLGIGLLGIVVVAAFLVMFPTAGRGAMNHVAPELGAWMAYIREMQPTYGAMAISMNLITPFLGLFYVVMLYEYARDDRDKRHRLLIVGLILGLCLLTFIGALYFRFLYFCTVACAPFAAAFLAHLGRTKFSFLQPDITVPLVAGWPTVMLLIVTMMHEASDPIPVIFATHKQSENGLVAIDREPVFDSAGRLIPPIQPNAQAMCDIFPMVHHLTAVEAKLQPAPADDQHIAMFYQNPTPAIVFYTDMRVISAPYHRNDDGLIDERRFYGTHDLADAYEVIERRGIDVIGVCISPVIQDPDLERPAIYDWATKGGDDQFSPMLIIPGEWVILARQELLEDWAPVIKLPVTDDDNDDDQQAADHPVTGADNHG